MSKIIATLRWIGIKLYTRFEHEPEIVEIDLGFDVQLIQEVL